MVARNRKPKWVFEDAEEPPVPLAQLREVARQWHARQGDLLVQSSHKVSFCGIAHFAVDAAGYLSLSIDLPPDKAVAVPQLQSLSEHGISNFIPDIVWYRLLILAREEFAKRGILHKAPKGIHHYGSDFLRDMQAEIIGTDVDALIAFWITAKDAVRSLIVPEVYDLAVQLMPGEPQIAVYNHAAQYYNEWRWLEKGNPSLLVPAYIAWQEGAIPAPNRFSYKQLKALAIKYGCTAQGWRIMRSLPADYYRQAISAAGFYQARPPLMALFVQIALKIAAIGLLPPSQLLDGWVMRPEEYPIWFCRAATRAWQQRATESEQLDWLCFDYGDAEEWLRAHPDLVPDANQQRAGWRWVQRQTDLWRGGNIQWATAIQVYSDAGFEVVPLTSGLAMLEEGRQMCNCLGRWPARCMAGDTQIFSVRDQGKPVADISLLKDGGRWRLGQVLGPYNESVSTPLHELAERLAQRYQQVVQAS